VRSRQKRVNHVSEDTGLHVATGAVVEACNASTELYWRTMKFRRATCVRAV